MKMNFKRLGLLGGHAARACANIAGLTPARLDFLATLVKKARCQREIAEVLCCSEPVISKMVRALVAKGLVERHIPVADERFRIVSLTAKGRAAMSSVESAWLFDGRGRESAQCLGEAYWSSQWWQPLDHIGLGFVCNMHVDADPPEPPFAAIRMHYRERPWSEIADGNCDVLDRSWPWTTYTPPPPPLELGVYPDPDLRPPPQ